MLRNWPLPEKPIAREQKELSEYAEESPLSGTATPGADVYNPHLDSTRKGQTIRQKENDSWHDW